MKKILVLFICLFSFPIISNAVSCTSSELSEATAFSSNVNIVYLIEMNGDSPTFSITLSNLTDDMAVIDKTTGKLHKGFKTTGSSLNIKTTSSGKYSFDIYSLKCKSKVATKAVTLPKYNPYYKDERCKGLEEYALCQRWSGYSGNKATFENDIKKILGQEKVEEEVEEVKVVKENKWYVNLTEILVNYWWAIVIIMILIIGIYYVIRSKRKKNEYNFKV